MHRHSLLLFTGSPTTCCRFSAHHLRLFSSQVSRAQCCTVLQKWPSRLGIFRLVSAVGTVTSMHYYSKAGSNTEFRSNRLKSYAMCCVVFTIVLRNSKWMKESKPTFILSCNNFLLPRLLYIRYISKDLVPIKNGKEKLYIFYTEKLQVYNIWQSKVHLLNWKCLDMTSRQKKM